MKLALVDATAPGPDRQPLLDRLLDAADRLTPDQLESLVLDAELWAASTERPDLFFRPLANCP